MDGKGVTMLWLGLVLVFVYISTTSADDGSKIAEGLRMHKQLTNSRHGVNSLKHIITEIDSDLKSAQKRTCAVGGGMSHHCLAQLIDSKMSTHDWLKSGLSPGRRKRSDASALHQAESALDRKITDYLRKRKALEILGRILEEMDTDLIHDQKRNCNFNLGGHCATESAASVADQWHYLNSHLSPGRKRRDTRLYRKLVQGKFFDSLN